MQPLRLAVVGTDTGVGKTHVTSLLTGGLRALGRRVWLHKPVACGDWQDGQAGDPRSLAPLVGDGQAVASLCRHQWPEACSPHLAAALAGDRPVLADLQQGLQPLLAGDHDLLVEGAGGVLSPLTDDGTVIDLCRSAGLVALLVTRPHLGTLNHTRLSVAALQGAGVTVLGLVVNEHEHVPPSAATDHAVEDLERFCELPVLARLTYTVDRSSEASGKDLAARLIAAT